MRYRLLSVANEDLSSAITFYERQSGGLGLQFLDAFEEAIHRVLACPDAWTPVSANQRRCLFRRLPFALLYTRDEQGILVTAVMDLRRDPTRMDNRLGMT